MPYAVANGLHCCAENVRGGGDCQELEGSHLEITDDVNCCKDLNYQDCVNSIGQTAICTGITEVLSFKYNQGS